MGLAGKERMEILETKEEITKEILSVLENTSISPDKINGFLEKTGTSQIKQKVKAISIAARPQVSVKEILQFTERGEALIIKPGDRVTEITESAEIKIKYEGIFRERK